MELILWNEAPTQQLFTCLHRRTQSGTESLLTEGNESNVIKMSSKSFFEEDDAAQANKFSKKAKESPFMLIGKSHESSGSTTYNIGQYKVEHTHTHTHKHKSACVC